MKLEQFIAEYWSPRAAPWPLGAAQPTISLNITEAAPMQTIPNARLPVGSPCELVIILLTKNNDYS
jgi:hypothetical protein